MEEHPTMEHQTDIEINKPEAPAIEEFCRRRSPLPRLELQDILDLHLSWLESNGENGRQADLSRRAPGRRRP